MIITSDLHTHTIHSHGKGTVEENVLAAIKKGLKTIAITDHGPSHNAYGIKDMEKYLLDIQNCKEKYKNDITVLSGVELNIISLDGELDLPKDYKNCFDILLFGYHKFVAVKDAKTFFSFYLPKTGSKKATDRATKAYIKALEKYDINIVSHPGYGLPIDKLELAKAAVKTNTMLEINAKHNEFSKEELIECAKMGVKFALNSDAHSTERIGDTYPSVLRATEAGLPISQILNAKEE